MNRVARICAIVSILLALVTGSVTSSTAAQRTGNKPPVKPAIGGDLSLLRYEASQLRAYPTSVLVSFFTRASQDYNFDGDGVFPAVPLKNLPMQKYLIVIQNELIHRGSVDELLATFAEPADSAQQYWMMWILQQIADARTEPRMRELATTGRDTRAYLAAKYLAERGDEWGLKQLVAGGYEGEFGLGWLVWTEEADLFGKYRYTPAVFGLVGRLNAVSPDVVEVALRSLSAIFPEAKRTFGTLDEAQEYWAHFVSRFSRPSSCRVRPPRKGIELRKTEAEHVTPRNEAWRALLETVESCPKTGSAEPCAGVYTDSRARYLLAEVCGPQLKLRPGIYVFALDGERMDFDFDSVTGDLAARTGCPADGDCFYSLRSTDGAVFDVELFCGIDKPRFSELRMQRGHPIEILDQCTCDYPC